MVAASALKETHPRLLSICQLEGGRLPVAAIYGANASGKTNAIRHSYRIGAVSNSHRRWEPDGPIASSRSLGSKERGASSRFEIDFLIGGDSAFYGFRLDAKAILEEWLFVYPNSKKQSWFPPAAWEANLL